MSSVKVFGILQQLSYLPLF